MDDKIIARRGTFKLHQHGSPDVCGTAIAYTVQYHGPDGLRHVIHRAANLADGMFLLNKSYRVRAHAPVFYDAMKRSR